MQEDQDFVLMAYMPSYQEDKQQKFSRHLKIIFIRILAVVG